MKLILTKSSHRTLPLIPVIIDALKEQKKTRSVEKVIQAFI